MIVITDRFKFEIIVGNKNDCLGETNHERTRPRFNIMASNTSNRSYCIDKTHLHEAGTLSYAKCILNTLAQFRMHRFRNIESRQIMEHKKKLVTPWYAPMLLILFR